jgi:polar amino acid transport system permease protein
VADVLSGSAAVPGRPPGPLEKVRITYWGRYVSAVIIVVIVVLLVIALAKGQIDYAMVPDMIVEKVMLQGLGNTIVLAVVAQVGAIVVGVVVALMRISKNPIARYVAWIYTWLFRGLPVLLQIVLWYNLALVFPVIRIGLPFTDLSLINESSNVLVTAFTAALLGLGLNESAYMAEIVRAGLGSVDRGQTEAAQSIGMAPLKVLRRIVLPQAMRVIIPPTGNDFINMLKGTSIASVIGFVELIKAANNLSSHNLAVVETLLAAAFWYMVLVSVASVGQYFLERRYSAADRTGRGAQRALLRRVGRGLATPPTVRTSA